MPNFIAEWYGVRLYPSAAGASGAIDPLREKQRPFLSDALEAPITCIKNPNSSGVCTIMECRSEDEWLFLGRYGLFEVQTMDFHGSYRHAVKALEAALDLHPNDFERQIDGNQEWLGRRIEGPNIANVFKRTIYQLILKFDLAGKDRCAGVVLGLPEAVWESWAPHFGGLDWADDGNDGANNSWILVLSPEQHPEAGYSKMEIRKEIRTKAQTLVHRAFTVTPERIGKERLPGLFDNIVRRVRNIYENTKPDGAR